jgi:CheY-like chemotaxis protein
MDKRDFLIVDDDPISNNICSTCIHIATPESSVRQFTDPRDALTCIQTVDRLAESSTILFLDINMPEMDGWEFLRRFTRLPQSVQSRFDIYMLTSSVNGSDKEHARINSLVKDYLEKPLTVAKVRNMLLQATSHA